jgi:hypothetical protein
MHMRIMCFKNKYKYKFEIKITVTCMNVVVEADRVEVVG